MNSKEKTLKALNHEHTGLITVDFGATPVSGIHALAVERLRKHFGLEQKPVKVTEPYQMLGEIEPDLMEVMGIDIIGIGPESNMFGIPQKNWKEWRTHWGQTVLVPGDFNTTTDAGGATYIYPEGDTSVPASAKMPADSYFFDAIVRQEPIDDMNLDVTNNLEEFGPWTDKDIQYWKEKIKTIENTDKAVVANFGGTGLGDIALVPAMNLKQPKGIRDIAEWYMSTVMRIDYVHEIFDKQTDIAIKNLQKAWEICGNKVDVAFICGTDFGTQDSTFCSPEAYDELWAPYYKKINNWIHQHTNWKTFKHCCGAVENFMIKFIESGFDIINPVQINAAGMDPKLLKERYGSKLTFWGGGVDTQKVLPFGNTQDVRKQVRENCRIFNQEGGFIFNTVHNIQANTPVENIVAMIEEYKNFK